MADEELVRVAMEEEEEEAEDDAEKKEAETAEAKTLGDDFAALDVSKRDGASDAKSYSSDEGEEDDDEESEESTLARMMGHARNTKKTANEGINQKASSEEDDDDRSVTTSVFDRAARNKPRKMLKKNKVGKKFVKASLESERLNEFGAQRHRIDEELEGVIESGSEFDSDDVGAEPAPPTRRPNFGFDALDAETEDDELFSDIPPNGSPTPKERSVSALEASEGEEDAEEPGRASSEKEPSEKAKKKPRRAKNKGGKNKTSSGDGVDGSAGGGANALRCSLCRLTFTSGNALHKHLKEAHSGTHKKKR